ncbi:hypothetical protein LJC56_07080 [Christensenellaceae bacterium OttesenSCG-928-K19]|nr:hypothetical protein [Christensenellaceae bacterium OttesenSCG-928-K19]
MKKITIVLDGVADRPNEKLGGKTPLEYAHTPNLDTLFQKSRGGVVKTIPDGLEIGSAVANLSLLGFDPHTYRGRAVIEAAGLEMPIDENDLYIRANMVTFEGGSFEDSKIKSYSAYEIATEKAEPVAKALAKEVFGDGYELHYCGSFRNILVVKGGKKLYPVDFMPAHDIIAQPIAQYIKTEGKQAPFFDLMRRSYEFLQDKGIDANGLWFWGASIMPDIKGDTAGRVALSETLLMDGITKISGIPNIGTKREGRSFEDFLERKLEKSLKAVRDYENIYVHIQEPDDLSHELMPVEKAQAVAAFDKVFLPGFLAGLKGEYTLKLSSDHFTFSDTGAHGGEPVPFLFYDSTRPAKGQGRYTEQGCKETGLSLTAAELGKW